MDIEHKYHIARDIYEKPRVCKDCGEKICLYPIPIHRGTINKATEPNVDLDLQIYYCTKSLGHKENHDNPKIKKEQRFES